MKPSQTIKRMPILINDNTWQHIVGQENDVLANTYQTLLQMQQSIDKIEAELLRTKREKRHLLADYLDDDASDTRALDGLKASISTLEQQIEDYELYLRLKPKELRQANLQLGIDTIDFLYRQLLAERDEQAKLDALVEAKRRELGELRDRKFALDDRLRKRYQYIHRLLDKQTVDHLDMAYGLSEQA